MKREHIIMRNYLLHVRKSIRSIVADACAEAKQSATRRVLPDKTYTLFGELVRLATDLLVSRLREEQIRVARRQSNYEPLFSIPPARRQPTPASKPLTLVESRALAAKRKVIEWQRKQKLAATKVKQYRKKVSYYTKKGVVP